MPDEAAKRQERLAVIYDAQCAWCRRWAAWIAARDELGSIRLTPRQDGDALRAYGISELASQRALQAVELELGAERVYRGAHAIVRAVSEMPSYRWVRHATRLPLAMPIANGFYALIARLRPRDDGCCR